MGGGRAPAHRVPHLVRGADPDYRRHARRRGFLVWCWADTTFHGCGSGRRSLPGDGSQGGGNDVVAATMSSGARRCGNDVVGRIAGGGSGGERGGRSGGAGSGAHSKRAALVTLGAACARGGSSARGGGGGSGRRVVRLRPRCGPGASCGPD